VGTTIAGFLGQTIGILQLLVVQGSGYALAGLLVYFTVARHDQTPDKSARPDATPLLDAPPGPQAGAPPGPQAGSPPAVTDQAADENRG
jgi:hypothetical protein